MSLTTNKDRDKKRDKAYCVVKKNLELQDALVGAIQFMDSDFSVIFQNFPFGD